jgi:hypothetical protein
LSDAPSRERALRTTVRLFPNAIVCYAVLIPVFYWGPEYLMALAVKPFTPELTIHAIMRLPEFAAVYVAPLTVYTVFAAYVFVLLVSGGGEDGTSRRPSHHLFISAFRLTFSGTAFPIFLLSASLNSGKFLFYTVLDQSIFGDSAFRLEWINIMQFISPLFSAYIFLAALNSVEKRRYR